MSLERTRLTNPEERHLALYSDIEHQITPHSNAKVSDTISQQFYTATKKPKTGLIVLTVLLTALISTALLLQYLPLPQLDKYRPIALWSQGKLELVKQANALSDVIDYTKCVDKGGVVVQEQPQYCILENKKYYQVATASSSSSIGVAAPIPKPLTASLLNTYITGKDAAVLTTGDVVYTGYVSQSTQYISQMVVRGLGRIDLANQTVINNYTLGAQQYDTTLHKLFATTASTQSITQVLTIDISASAATLYPGYKGVGAITTTTIGATSAYDIVVILVGSDYTISLSHTLPQSFSAAVNKKFAESCIDIEVGQAQITCMQEKVLTDKSLSEKINKDTADLLKLFALAA
jgi:hypothetical protein